jgi:hypothetical protein
MFETKIITQITKQVTVSNIWPANNNGVLWYWHVSVFAVSHWQWRTEGGLGVSSYPKFRNFAKGEPNSLFRGIYIHNNKFRLPVSFIFSSSGTPHTGQPLPDPRSLCPLFSTEFVDTLKKFLAQNSPTLPPKMISVSATGHWKHHWLQSVWEYSCLCAADCTVQECTM